MVYIYAAALYCDDCGRRKQTNLRTAGKVPANMNPDTGEWPDGTTDSDAYPYGPMGNGGGEADCPQSCDDCGVFLENPLTDDGARYVEEAVLEALRDPTRTGGVALKEWAPYYGVSVEPCIKSAEEPAWTLCGLLVRDRLTLDKVEPFACGDCRAAAARNLRCWGIILPGEGDAAAEVLARTEAERREAFMFLCPRCGVTLPADGEHHDCPHEVG